MILPSSSQLAPRPLPASHKVIGEPPWMEIFFILLSAKNPIHCPFGEKNGSLDKRGWKLGGYSFTMWNSDTFGR